MKLPIFHLAAEQHDALFFVWPSLHVTVERYSPCTRIHGFSVHLAWGCWTGMLQVIFRAGTRHGERRD